MVNRDELLRTIDKNSRIGVSELAVLLGEPELDVANELRALEDEGIICGYHTMIDWSKTSIDKVMALIEVKVDILRSQTDIPGDFRRKRGE